MLGLKLPTDPRWVNIVEKNIDEILIDHAHCELKAASTANSLIMSFPEYDDLVTEMVFLVKEEMSHFKIKDFHFKFVANQKHAMVCLDIESFDKRKNKLLFDQILELKSNLTEDYLPDVIFDEIYLLENSKIIHRIYVKYNGEFNIHNKNTWQGVYLFFKEAMNQFELFYEDYEDFIKQVIY